MYGSSDMSINGCKKEGSPGFPATGSSMNKFYPGAGPGAFNCTGFIGLLKSETWAPDWQCSTEPSSSKDITFTGQCDVCTNVKKGRCSDKCVSAGLYPQYEKYIVDQYCKSPTDICITGHMDYMQ